MIQFSTEDACIAHVRRLQAGHRTAGDWSLAQNCWHLNVPVARSLKEPDSPEPTAEQREQQAFIDQVIASGWPEGLQADGEMMPPDEVDDSAIDEYISSLEHLRDYQPAYVDAFIFGPVPTATFRRFALIHAADHLKAFEPA